MAKNYGNISHNHYDIGTAQAITVVLNCAAKIRVDDYPTITVTLD